MKKIIAIIAAAAFSLGSAAATASIIGDAQTAHHAVPHSIIGD